MKKKKITIGIPAFNEENNIKNLLKDILTQKSENYVLEAVLIISDGSTDNTVQEARKIKDKRIVIEDNKKRIGKAKRLNHIFTINKSDVLILLDGDVHLRDGNTLDLLVQSFIDNEMAAIVYGNQIPNKPTNYFGKLAYFGFYAWEEAKKQVNAERYNCFGQIIAFSKAFLINYRLPEKQYITEDTYSFYYAKKNRHKTYFQKDAAVYFNLPIRISDYVKQMNRYLTTSEDMESYFGKEIIAKYETITTKIKLQALIKSSIENPLNIVIGYIFLQIFTKFRSLSHTEKVTWDMAQTTKNKI